VNWTDADSIFISFEAVVTLTIIAIPEFIGWTTSARCNVFEIAGIADTNTSFWMRVRWTDTTSGFVYSLEAWVANTGVIFEMFVQWTTSICNNVSECVFLAYAVAGLDDFIDWTLTFVFGILDLEFY
jgi:hypothetical protein